MGFDSPRVQAARDADVDDLPSRTRERIERLVEHHKTVKPGLARRAASNECRRCPRCGRKEAPTKWDCDGCGWEFGGGLIGSPTNRDPAHAPAFAGPGEAGIEPHTDEQGVSHDG